MNDGPAARLDVPEQRRAVPDDVREAAERLAVIIMSMRTEGRFNVDTFLRAYEAGMGGTLALEAPCKRLKRSVPEARYVSEGVQLSAGSAQTPFE